jgi:catechol 2,3-dioxygenase-like lactoylglutathione lyase family enzyme
VSRIRRFDHVGITVRDLDAVTAFFVGLGLEVEGRMFMEGEFVDTVIGRRESSWPWPRESTDAALGRSRRQPPASLPTSPPKARARRRAAPKAAFVRIGARMGDR